MDLSRLRYFLVVAQTGHIARAATLLGLTSAALSKAMTKLQEETGLQLLANEGRGIALTEEGRRFAETIRPRVRDLEEALDQVREGKDARSARPFRLATFEVFSSHVLGRLIHEEFRDTPIEVHELTPGHLEEALARDEVDLGVSYIPVPHARVEFLKIGSVRMGIYARKGAFPARTPFEDLPFATPLPPVSGTATKVTGLDGWPDHERPRRIVYRVDLMESALSLLREGLAVAYLPDVVVKAQNRFAAEAFRLAELGEDLLSERARSQDVYLVLRKGRAEDAEAKKVARFLRKSFRAT